MSIGTNFFMSFYRSIGSLDYFCRFKRLKVESEVCPWGELRPPQTPRYDSGSHEVGAGKVIALGRGKSPLQRRGWSDAMDTCFWRMKPVSEINLN